MASLPSTTFTPATFSSAKSPSLAPRTVASLAANKFSAYPSPSSLSPRALTVVGNPVPGLRSRTSGTFRCFASVLTPQLKSTLDTVVNSHKVVLFMKGTKDFPQCGFSNTVVQILRSFNVPFETIDILENELLRQGLKEYSSWPTFPQLYIEGEFFGGCDITVEAYKSGELQELLEKAMCT
ncbi:uncharacterized monothiol glutaredoxin ycf64-like [Rhodamnia argentea]|uniref:Uncharacterized monothiol glutaredoxin ycf64-like n=1 Tax=Rhodamnia argentea TaxID=178133 RepID=A0A8B8R219_9MYRT|nr:uncharacterized monothiol glutaredoxin ycf64-like [Rhodamnia argentea]